MGEQFLGRPRRKCLDQVVILDERHLHRRVEECRATLNGAQRHQGIEQRVPGRTERLGAPPVRATLSARPVLNGVHYVYS